MGLDMYFYARKNDYVSSFRGENDNTNYPEDLKVMGDYIEKANFKSVDAYVDYQIGYFRKFNALHAYIVNNYADGEDCCQDIYLYKNDIETILSVLQEVVNDPSKAEKLFSTQSGFFFGSTDYDEYYFEDVKDAIELFQLILKEVNFDNYDIVYRASW